MKSPDPDVVIDPAEVATVGQPKFMPVRLVVMLAALAALGWWQGWKVLAVIGAIVVIIFLHELGHFVMARRAGMKVTEFFIGFGPRIWSFRRGEVEYGIKAIPAGAYVRIIGMSNLDEVSAEDEPRTYRQKSFGQRFGVAVAGSTMHFFLALVLSFVVFIGYGAVSKSAWAVAETTPGSAATDAGIGTGDRVVAVDGVAVKTFDEMTREVQRHPDQRVDLVVERDGRRVTKSVQLGAKAAIIGTVGEDLRLAIRDGVVRINSVQSGGRAAGAGLHDGDVIRSINGVQLSSLGDLRPAVDAAKGGKLVVTSVAADGGAKTATIDLGTAVDVTDAQGFLGVGGKYVRESMSVPVAAGRTFSQFGEGIALSVTGIGKVFNPANLAHFVGTTLSNDTTNDSVTSTPTPASKTANATAKANENRPVSIIGIIGIGNQMTDLAAFLGLLVGVNIMIGAINLIPLPPFDGGHVSIAVYEKLRELFRRDGRRYYSDATKIMPVIYVVLMVMVTVGLLAGYTDIVHPIQL